MDFLAETVIFLAAAVVAVPLSRRLSLGAILGYLAAGVIMGPYALGLIRDAEEVLHFAEFGVVLLLFIIGLELQPSRLWVTRNAVFDLGGAQVVVTATVIGGVAYVAGAEFGPAVVIGLGLALSSTAFFLQLLAEKGQLPTHHGRAAFAILLFQDVASAGTPVWLAIAQVAVVLT